MTTIEQMVQREVLCCMSSLVSTLAQGRLAGTHRHYTGVMSRELQDMIKQAAELVAPVLDYEKAATQEGWSQHPTTETWFKTVDDETTEYDSLQTLCEHESLDPYKCEVFEHWAVSQWLADKLIAQGERVDTDFAGLNIWARTTTGQAISMDGCIQRIYADMMAPHALDSVAPGA